MAEDFYSLLHIPYDATPEEIRSAYFGFARTMHPDVNHDPEVKDEFLAIQQAFETLSNPKKKATYDASLPAEVRNVPKISVGTQYSMSAIPLMGEPQLAYALVDLVCTADAGKGRLSPSHVCLVLDRSTSMQGPRMDMVKSSALILLQQLRAQDFLSVVVFSDRAEVLIPPTHASALSKSDHRISLLQTGGGTEILQGLTRGIEQLRMTDNSFIRHMVMLTDGHTYGDDEECLKVAKAAAEEGISINVLGIGHEWNDDLMDRISGLSGGNAMLIATPRDLEHFMMQKLSELETIYARGLRLEFETSPDFNLRFAFRLSPNVGMLDTTSPILLGDIHHRRSVSFLLEFMVPPLTREEEHLKLAQGYIRMEIPGQKIPPTRIMVNLSRPVRANVEVESPPAVIIEAMSKLTLYRMQERVRHEVEEGQIDKATKHMHYLATHLLTQGDRELAHTVLIEAEHIQQSRRFSSEGEKRIKYGTRALILPPGPEYNQ
jgi:Ca-activated chloride channel family protein